MTILIGVFRFVFNIIYMFFKLLPVKRKIVFLSRQADRPSLDFEMLGECIRNEHPGYETVFLCKTLKRSAAGALSYIPHLFTQMYHIATSEAAVLDSYCIPISVLKQRDSLVVIQMWHSVGTMKKFGYSILDEGEGSSSKLANAMRMHRGYDYVLAAGHGYIDHLAQGFDIDKEKIVVLPLPRVEFLGDSSRVNAVREKILKRYPELDGKRVIVYVPTFRKGDQGDFAEALTGLADAVSAEDTVLVLKAHPLTRNVPDLKGVIADKEFSSMEMLTIADQVISDYSCIIYEAAILGEPVYFYTYDRDRYRDTRDMYLDYESEMPGPVESDPVKLAEIMKSDYSCEKGADTGSGYDYEKLQGFLEKYVEISGRETSNIADFIFSKIKTS